MSWIVHGRKAVAPGALAEPVRCSDGLERADHGLDVAQQLCTVDVRVELEAARQPAETHIPDHQYHREQHARGEQALGQPPQGEQVEDDSFLLMFNAHTESVTFTVPVRDSTMGAMRFT